MKKILVPTDFSDHAFNAVKAAASIARKTNAELLLLHIIELPQEAMDAIKPGHDIPEIMFFKQWAEKRLSETSLSPELNGLNVSQILLLGRTVNKVAEAAADNNVDLIVMGSHGASGFKELFVGSNTEKVVRHSEVPVLVIKNDETEIKMERVVFASDFMVENKASFVNALNFFRTSNVKPHFLMVNTPNNFKPTHVAEKFVADLLKEFDMTEYEFSIYNDLDIEKGILNFSERVNADLIAMGTHGRKGISKFLNGSISEDLVNHSSRSLLTFKI